MIPQQIRAAEHELRSPETEHETRAQRIEEQRPELRLGHVAGSGARTRRRHFELRRMNKRL